MAFIQSTTMLAAWCAFLVGDLGEVGELVAVRLDADREDRDALGHDVVRDLGEGVEPGRLDRQAVDLIGVQERLDLAICSFGSWTADDGAIGVPFIGRIAWASARLFL